MLETKQRIEESVKEAESFVENGNYLSALQKFLDVANLVAERDWYIPVRKKIHSILSCDIDDDGCLEVIYGSEGGKVTAVKSKPKNENQTIGYEVMWEFPTEAAPDTAWVTGIEPIFHVNTKECEIAVASDKLYVLKSNGVCDRTSLLESNASSLKVICNNKGSHYIAVGLFSGKVIIFDENLKRLNEFPKKGSKNIGTVVDITCGDFDGSGNMDIAAVSEDKHVYILDCAANEKDSIQTSHWICNIDSIQINSIKSKLYIGEFRGEVFPYNPETHTSQRVRLGGSGILDLKVMQLNDGNTEPVYIVGSTDRQFGFYTLKGDLIWTFEAGLGQRAISLHKDQKGTKLFIGTESGEIFAYTIHFRDELLVKIQNAYVKLKEEEKIEDLMDIQLPAEQLHLLRSLITSKYNPIKKTASFAEVKKFEKYGNMQYAIYSLMEIWWNECEYMGNYTTNGRVYDVKISNFTGSEDKVIISGSADGKVYCLTSALDEKWTFESPFGGKGEIRGVYVNSKYGDFVAVASADKSIYCLDNDGKPKWNFQHSDDILFVCTDFTETNSNVIFAGTEDHCVLAINADGVLLWKYDKIEKRIRAITTCEIDSKLYVIAGSDDCKVYIIDSDGVYVREIAVPHYVLVVKLFDINGDGIPEILAGSEDGCLHTYDFNGNFLWRFITDSWVAALDVLCNEQTGEIEIVIGSQDNHVYGLNFIGALLWQYETAQRVRTISGDSTNATLVFGSYDENIYLLKRTNRDIATVSLNKLYEQQLCQLNGGFSGYYKNNKNRYERGFYYLFTNDLDELCQATSDYSEIVLASIAYNLLKNFTESQMAQEAISEIIKTTTRGTRALIFREISSLYNNINSKTVAYELMWNAVTESKNIILKIDAFRHWVSMCSSAHDVLIMIEEIVSVNDEYIVDEIYHACKIALQLPHDKGDLSTRRSVKRIIPALEKQYPKIVRLLRKEFL